MHRPLFARGSHHDQAKGQKTEPKSNGHHERHAPRRATRRPRRAARSTGTRRNSRVFSRTSISAQWGVSRDSCFTPSGQTVQVNVTPDVGFAVVRGIGQHVEARVKQKRKKPAGIPKAITLCTA